MVPILMQLPGFKLYTYGAFLMLAFFWGCFLVWHTVRLSSYKEEDVFDGLMISLLVSLITGRLAHVVMYFSDFGLRISRIILINGYPGMSLFGMLFGGIITYMLYAKRHKMHFRELSDYLVPALFLSLGIAKIGAFFAGVEVGRQTSFLLAVRYAGYDGMRHLIALYEGLLFFLGAYASYRILYTIRREQLFKGFNILFFILFFSITQLLFIPLKEIAPDSIIQPQVYAGIYGFFLLTTAGYLGYYLRHNFFSFLRFRKKRNK